MSTMLQGLVHYAMEIVQKKFLFTLHPISERPRLKYELLDKLKDLKLINSDAQLIEALYSHVILPTLDDGDLHTIKMNLRHG